ncbi:MAG: adenylate/guanylate cyclase domain-containing protein [Anaerolineales bacterium]
MANEIELLQQSISALEAQRAVLGDSVVDTALAPMREKLLLLQSQQQEQQRKFVTILFADVSGFTALAETLDPEDIGDLINKIWQELDSIILAQGGSIDKHLGDGIMAIWGREQSHENDPERAIRAALEMMNYLKSEPGLSAKFRIRVGINSGSVLLGSLGTQGEYTAMGDTVNVAARLEKAAPVGKILISADTYRHVRGLFNVESMPELEVKGKSEPLQTYIVHGARPRAFRPGTRGVEGIETRMIGRSQPFQILTTAIEDTTRKTGLSVFTVIGDVGIGKSRLLHEVERWLEKSSLNLWLFKARADQQRQEQALSLVHDLFFYYFQIQETDSDQTAREKLEHGIVNLLGEKGREIAHFIGQLLSFDFSESPYLQSLRNDPRAFRSRAFDAVVEFFRKLTESAPLLFLLEDLHWADESSLNLLQYFREQGAHLQCVMIATARPSFFERALQEWEQQLPGVKVLHLKPLDEEDSHRLTQEILRKVSNLPLSFEEMLVQHADGNPFYIEELIKMFIENGSIIKNESEWLIDTERVEAVRVPPSLVGVLQARLDRLSYEERLLLQRASAIGRVFWDDALLYIEEQEPALGNIKTHLRSLAQKELIYKRNQSAFAGAEEYMFRHALLRDVVYEQSLKAQRRIHHRHAAQWLLNKSGERIQAYAGVLAEHFDLAGETDQAIDWYLRAGQTATDTFIFESAVEYLQRALALMQVNSGDQRRTQAHEQLAYVNYQLTRWQEALQGYQAMLQSAIQMQDLPAQMRALHGLAQVNEIQGDYDAVLESVAQAEKRYDLLEPANPAEMAQILLEKSRALYYQGKYPAAKISAQRGLDVALETNSSAQTARLYNILGMIYVIEGHYERALEYKIQSLQHWRRIGNQVYEAAMLNNIGEIYRLMGENERAISFYEESLILARQVRDLGQIVVSLSNMGGTYVAMGEFDAAIHALETAIHTSQEKVFTEVETLCFLAEAYLGKGRLEQALEIALRALHRVEQQESSFCGKAWHTLGLVAEYLAAPIPFGKERLDARQCFERAFKIEKESGALREQAIVLWNWAKYEQKRGQAEMVDSMRHQAHAILQQLNLPRLLEKMQREIPQ